MRFFQEQTRDTLPAKPGIDRQIDDPQVAPVAIGNDASGDNAERRSGHPEHHTWQKPQDEKLEIAIGESGAKGLALDGGDGGEFAESDAVNDEPGRAVRVRCGGCGARRSIHLMNRSAAGSGFRNNLVVQSEPDRVTIEIK